MLIANPLRENASPLTFPAYSFMLVLIRDCLYTTTNQCKLLWSEKTCLSFVGHKAVFKELNGPWQKKKKIKMQRLISKGSSAFLIPACLLYNHCQPVRVEHAVLPSLEGRDPPA